MKKALWLDRWIIQAPVYVALCRSEEALRWELRRLRIAYEVTPGFLGDGTTASTMTFSNSEERVCIVCLGDVRGSPPTRVAALLVHEAVHVWQEVARVMGETDPSSEFEAYSIQALSEKLFDAFVQSEKMAA